MGYQALLFCSEEKTARLVTQVLTELDFSVEPSNEPFAAVKRLTTQHFDAIIVDCDNEQNAALLFKSARNSGPNRASLAVAVVEGQPGIAKAFRIGANLVLTKPINVEQSKGTLRVARGLLKKPDAARQATVLAPPPNFTPPAEPIAPPSRPTATNPGMARPLTPMPPMKPVFTPPAPRPPQEHPASALLELEEEPAPQPEPGDAAMLESMPDPLSLTPAASSPWQPVPGDRPFAASSSRDGAAAAPAPIREMQKPVTGALRPRPAAPPPAMPAEPTVRREEPKPRPVVRRPVAVAAESSVPAPTFSIPQQESGGGKKIILVLAVVALVLAGVYFGWSKFQARTSPAPAPATTPVQPPAQQISASPSPATPEQQTPDQAATSPAADTSDSQGQEASQDIVLSTPKEAPAAKPQAAIPIEKPSRVAIVVKSSPAGSKREESSPQAPPVVAMTEGGNSAAISKIADMSTATAKPVLQTLKVSQGISQGLLLKKVQPDFPSQARQLRIEGTVQLQATVGKDGSVARIKALGGHPILVRAASDAVKQWKYKPYLLNGQPIEFETQVTVNFKLP